MSYISWRIKNEDRCLQIVNDGAIEQLPAWSITSHSELSDSVIAPIVDEMLKNKYMIPINFACVFAEYLFEQYNIQPVDIELFTQMILKSELEQVSRLATKQAPMLLEAATQKLKSLLPEDVQDQVDEALSALKELEEGNE